MAEAKTKVTQTSVDEHIAAKASAEQSADCIGLMALLSKVTKQEPKMWGPSIIGYGSYQYTYDSGRKGESCLAGFAIRGRELVLYLVLEGAKQEALLAKLGKHRRGKGCLYIRSLSDVDQKVLEKLIKGSVAETKRLYGAG